MQLKKLKTVLYKCKHLNWRKTDICKRKTNKNTKQLKNKNLKSINKK